MQLTNLHGLIVGIGLAFLSLIGALQPARSTSMQQHGRKHQNRKCQVAAPLC